MSNGMPFSLKGSVVNVMPNHQDTIVEWKLVGLTLTLQIISTFKNCKKEPTFGSRHLVDGPLGDHNVMIHHFFFKNIFGILTLWSTKRSRK